MKKETFIKKAQVIHGTNYNYDKVNYSNRETKVVITCHKHGDFYQTPRAHLRGLGCRLCANEKLSSRKAYTLEKFLEKANIKHSQKYDYSKVIYKNSRTKIEIICPHHGSFWQYPSSHLQGIGCPKCAGISMNTEDFINKAVSIHGNRYNYSLVKYKNYYTPIMIICKKHGIFEQTPDAHLKGEGCPICRESKGESKIRQFLLNKGISFKQQYKIDNCRNKLPLPFDFAIFNKIGTLSCLIEYQGEQHFKSVEAWGGILNFNNIQKRDTIKRNFCEQHQIPLYYITYKEDINNALNKLFTGGSICL